MKEYNNKDITQSETNSTQRYDNPKWGNGKTSQMKFIYYSM